MKNGFFGFRIDSYQTRYESTLPETGGTH